MNNPNNLLASAQARYGQFLFFRNDDPIGACLHYYGEWAQQEFDLFDLILKPTSNVIDIGANIGTHSVYFSKRCNQGRVVSVEPQLFIFEILATNILLNGCFNVIPMHAACSSETKQMSMTNINPFHGEKINYGEFKINSNDSNGILTNCIMLDSLMDYGKFDFIKLDVEGHEEEVLSGGKKLLDKHRPMMYVEFNSKKGNDSLLEKLSSLDYEMYWHVYPKYNPNNLNKQSSNIWEGPGYEINNSNLDLRYESNVLCVHKKEEQPQGLLKVMKGSNITNVLFDLGYL